MLQPPQCNHTAAPPTPPRPSPSEDFEAAVDVEVRVARHGTHADTAQLFRNGQQVFGQGRMASDQTGNKFVEEFDVEDNAHRQEIRCAARAIIHRRNCCAAC